MTNVVNSGCVKHFCKCFRRGCTCNVKQITCTKYFEKKKIFLLYVTTESQSLQNARQGHYRRPTFLSILRLNPTLNIEYKSVHLLFSVVSWLVPVRDLTVRIQSLL